MRCVESFCMEVEQQPASNAMKVEQPARHVIQNNDMQINYAFQGKTI